MLVLINPPPLLLVFHFHLIAKTSPFSFQNFENITEGIIKDLFSSFPEGSQNCDLGDL